MCNICHETTNEKEVYDRHCNKVHPTCLDNYNLWDVDSAYHYQFEAANDKEALEKAAAFLQEHKSEYRQKNVVQNITGTILYTGALTAKNVHYSVFECCSTVGEV
jgi:hypothetical protein